MYIYAEITSRALREDDLYINIYTCIYIKQFIYIYIYMYEYYIYILCIACSGIVKK